jgi:hypothetical protein
MSCIRRCKIAVFGRFFQMNRTPLEERSEMQDASSRAAREEVADAQKINVFASCFAIKPR